MPRMVRPSGAVFFAILSQFLRIKGRVSDIYSRSNFASGWVHLEGKKSEDSI